MLFQFSISKVSFYFIFLKFWYYISFCCVVQNILFQFTCSQYSLLCCRLGSIYIRRSCINAHIEDTIYSRYTYNTIYSRYIQYNISIYNFSFFHFHELIYIIKARKKKGVLKRVELVKSGTEIDRKFVGSDFLLSWIPLRVSQLKSQESRQQSKCKCVRLKSFCREQGLLQQLGWSRL